MKDLSKLDRSAEYLEMKYGEAKTNVLQEVRDINVVNPNAFVSIKDVSNGTSSNGLAKQLLESLEGERTLIKGSRIIEEVITDEDYSEVITILVEEDY